ncbi:hypothetical protein C3H34_08720 [Campylobacter jejuni]|uniref:Uncharacterized protein n=1 Tax=Campylobacter jejuni TaxID=197 RepID=A0A431EDW3_CAMJU|nr:hypothetical protein [Campylobacter jejuni]ECQ7085848.1 hypothetical protein [Campylobacter jejuni]EDA5833414.1 hypothetical protein [Campylobacter jejuni]RTI82866.1 hypothetical protein C3I10_06225 [Campylobacter jejuni]RTJ04450.1 hypothetical protein C3H99_06490 [Campylobacter jejuni]RTJ44989.1 hypothetical protein C3H68_08155 [Campylobacter jejuni]
MSKPLNEEIFVEFKSDLAERKNEVLLQVLELLETFRSGENEKMARISSELTEILENEENLEKILNAKNLEELLNILTALNEDKMIKVYEVSYLKEKFPNVMVGKFLK